MIIIVGGRRKGQFRSVVSVLERPGSPSILEEHNCSKKGRRGDVTVVYDNPLGVADMEAEDTEVSQDQSIAVDVGSSQQQIHPQPVGATPAGVEKQSYASMVAGSQEKGS
ncbi:hypothetical protein V6N13_003409 [Hibiscus sabdariffa]|uniref:Uncharacterized protein n=1 Tax=Hibiscus sabdariffa TaxID=183260 RepID=A0ABR2AHI6_9ROSI